MRNRRNKTKGLQSKFIGKDGVGKRSVEDTPNTIRKGSENNLKLIWKGSSVSFVQRKPKKSSI